LLCAVSREYALGMIALTLMPDFRPSCDSARVSPNSAAFAVM
jgi:hypothetical protein